MGGIDQLSGNKRGYGKCLEEVFMLMGPTALSMVGMLCLIPLISAGFRSFIVPFFSLTGADPSVLGGLLAIDMGGYQLAKDLAENPVVELCWSADFCYLWLYPGFYHSRRDGNCGRKGQRSLCKGYSYRACRASGRTFGRRAFMWAFLFGSVLEQYANFYSVPFAWSWIEIFPGRYDDRFSDFCKRYEAFDYTWSSLRCFVLFFEAKFDTRACTY